MFQTMSASPRQSPTLARRTEEASDNDGAPDVALTPTSGMVLGLVWRYGRLTSHELKKHVANGMGRMWPFPHAQLYSEPLRLTEAGLLREEEEATGRRRRWFELTPRGRAALARWVATPSLVEPQLRDVSLLQLLFADVADPEQLGQLVDAELERRRQRLLDLEARQALIGDGEPAAANRQLLFELGIATERAVTEVWERLQADPERIRRLTASDGSNGVVGP
jgi:DNA-binding PadR family transcriptional regulator